MDMALTAEQGAVQKAVRQWVDDVVVPRALDNDRAERFPQEALDGLRETGFLGLSIPEQYGGGGGDPMSYVLFIEELGRGDANVRSIVSVHLGLVAGSIERWGTPEQKSQWLPRNGDRTGARLLRADRAGPRLQPGRPAGLRREAARRRLPAQRHQGSSSPTAPSPA